jgi:hypothetical protein
LPYINVFAWFTIITDGRGFYYKVAKINFNLNFSPIRSAGGLVHVIPYYPLPAGWQATKNPLGVRGLGRVLEVGKNYAARSS